jgi:Patatin phospholipase
LRQPDFEDLAKYKVFDNIIIPIANTEQEPVSSSADFFKASIERRIAAGYRDAAKALANPPKATAHLKMAMKK